MTLEGYFLAAESARQSTRIQACPANKRKYGIKSGPNKGKLAAWSKSSAISALKMRHSTKPKLTKQQLETLLRKCAKYAPAEAAAAREKDNAHGHL